MKTPKELAALARELRLTKMQRAFAHELAVNGGNQTKAAEAAGVDPVRSRFQGSRWAAMPRLKKYLEALTAEARALAEKNANDAVANLSEVLRTLTSQMRVRPQDYFEIRRDKDGKACGYLFNLDRVAQAPTGVVAGVHEDRDGIIHIDFASPDKAASRLLDHYELTAGLQPQFRSQPFTVNFLMLDEQTLRLLDRAQAQFELNATRANQARAIETTAKDLTPPGQRR